jgi:replicative DNA helicase
VETRGSKLFVDDAISSIEAIRSQALWRKHEANIGMLAIDHLQLLKSEAMPGRSRKHVVAEIMSGLRSLARELDIA